VCDLETSRIGAPYIYDISHLRVKISNYRPGQAVMIVGGWGFQNVYTVDTGR
jgi:hypothetical protein